MASVVGLTPDTGERQRGRSQESHRHGREEFISQLDGQTLVAGSRLVTPLDSTANSKSESNVVGMVLNRHAFVLVKGVGFKHSKRMDCVQYESKQSWPPGISFCAVLALSCFEQEK
jgi:hypothetical protein